MYWLHLLVCRAEGVSRESYKKGNKVIKWMIVVTIVAVSVPTKGKLTNWKILISQHDLSKTSRSVSLCALCMYHDLTQAKLRRQRRFRKMNGWKVQDWTGWCTVCMWPATKPFKGCREAQGDWTRHERHKNKREEDAKFGSCMQTQRHVICAESHLVAGHFWVQ